MALLRRKMERSEPLEDRFRIIKSNLDFLLYKPTNWEEILENSKTDLVQHPKNQKLTSRGFKNCLDKTHLSMTKSEQPKKTSDCQPDSSRSFKLKSRIFLLKMMTYVKKLDSMTLIIRNFKEMDKTSWRFLPKNSKD